MPDTVLTGSLTAADGTGGANPPAGSVLEIGCQDHPAVSIDLEGAFTATVVIEASAEDAPAVDWFTPIVLTATGVAGSASLTVAARRFISAAGLARVRLRCTAFTSGPITATLRAGQGFVSSGGGGGGGGGAVTVADGADVAEGTTTDALVQDDNAGTLSAKLRGLNTGVKLRAGAAVIGGVTQSGTWNVGLSTGANVIGGVTQSGTWNVGVTGTAAVTQSGAWTVQQGGTPTAVANAWPVKITDGSSVGAVKAASTAAGAADPSQVVAFSPNSPLPTGANVVGAVTQSGTWNVTVNTALPTGANVIGAVTQSGTWNVTVNTALPTGANVIGAVTQSGTWNVTVNTALPTGANVIGAVTQSGTWNVTASGTVTANQGTQNGAGTASWNVQGAGAAGAAVVGNPNLMAVTDGTNAQTLKQAPNANSAQAVAGIGFQSVALWSSAADYRNWGSATAVGDAGVSQMTGAVLPYDWNGASIDKHRSNVDVTLLASASRTTTQTSADIVCYNLQAIFVTLDVTAVGTGSVTLTINYKDPASGKYILLLSGAAVTTNVTNMYKVDPRGPTAVANVNAWTATGRIIQIVLTSNNANPVTASVGYTQLPC